MAGLEGAGIPSVMIASSAFVDAARAQAAALGIEPRRVFVAHPIQDRTDVEMRSLADTAVQEVVDALTK